MPVSYNFRLALAEPVSDSNTVFGNPATTELEEIVHPVDVNLRPDEHVIGCVDVQPETGAHLKVIGTFNVAIGTRAARKLIAIAGRIVELNISRAQA